MCQEIPSHVRWILDFKTSKASVPVFLSDYKWNRVFQFDRKGTPWKRDSMIRCFIILLGASIRSWNHYIISNSTIQGQNGPRRCFLQLWWHLLALTRIPKLIQKEPPSNWSIQVANSGAFPQASNGWFNSIERNAWLVDGMLAMSGKCVIFLKLDMPTWCKFRIILFNITRHRRS